MALIRIDERTLALNVLCGAEEKYEPSEQIKGLSARLTVLRNKLTEFKKKEEQFMVTEVSPELKAIDAEIQVLNEATYPELKELKQKAQEKK